MLFATDIGDRSHGEEQDETQRSVRLQLSRPMISAGPVIMQAVSWSKSSSFWDTFQYRRQSDTSVANNASITQSMIESGSNQTRRDLPRFCLTGRLLGTNPAFAIPIYSPTGIFRLGG